MRRGCPAEQAGAAAAAQATPDVAAVSPAGPVEGYASYLVTTSVPPYGASGHAVIVQLRQRLGGDAPGSLVGGDPAVQYDITLASGHDAVVLIPLILLVIALFLRAVVAPLVLVATTALSFAASFGLANLLWHYGLGYSGIESQVPLYIFVFLVALGVDYNIFLTARIREEAEHLGTGKGILRWLSVTGGVITAAGVVLAATFAALIHAGTRPGRGRQRDTCCIPRGRIAAGPLPEPSRIVATCHSRLPAGRCITWNSGCPI